MARRSAPLAKDSKPGVNPPRSAGKKSKAGAKHPNYERNVFINCPFDDEYYDLLKILIFTITYLDFIPRISLETSDSGEIRLEKISRLVKESKYSIHDLSRLQAKTLNDFYRLNMPFELGIDYGLRRFNKHFQSKRMLILEKNKYDYMKAISDINGMDIKNHDNDPDTLVKCIRSWFSETAGITPSSPRKISSDYYDFQKDLFTSKVRRYSAKYTETDSENYAKEEIKEMTVPEYITEIKRWLKKLR